MPSMGMLYAFNITTTSPLPSGVPIQLRAYAVNGVGVGAYSEVLNVTSDSVPLFMNMPTIELDSISPTSIYVTWDGIIGSDTGGDSASFYGLQWDQGNDSWTDVVPRSAGMVNGYTVVSQTPIASAIPLRFRTYAANGVGDGAFSEVLNITSDSVPLLSLIHI